MRKEWIRTDEERRLRELKRLYKRENQLEKSSQISIVERKKNRLPVFVDPVSLVNQDEFRSSTVSSSHLDLSFDPQ